MTHELIEAEIVETLPIKRGKQEIISTQQNDIEEEIKYLSRYKSLTLYSQSVTTLIVLSAIQLQNTSIVNIYFMSLSFLTLEIMFKLITHV